MSARPVWGHGSARVTSRCVTEVDEQCAVSKAWADSSATALADRCDAADEADESVWTAPRTATPPTPDKVTAMITSSTVDPRSAMGGHRNHTDVVSGRVGIETGCDDREMSRTDQMRSSGAWAGIVALAVGLGLGELAAASRRTWWSPFDAVANRFIDVVPAGLKDVAIALFGTRHRIALAAGMAVVLVMVAAVAGVTARRRGWWAAVVAGAGLGLVAVAATWSSAGASGESVVPAVGATVGAVATLIWLNRSPLQDSEAVDPGRRSALVSGVALAAGVAMVGGGRWGQRRWSAMAQRAAVALPVPWRRRPPVPSDPPVPDLSSLITPNHRFFRIDTAFTIPRVDTSTWHLKVTGLVERDMVWTLEELLDRPHVEADITLVCVSNEVGGDLVGTARWQGVLLADLLAEAGVRPEADQIVGRSVDGFTAGFPVAVVDGRDALVALGMNGEALPARHGFPARLVVPGLYGYVSATKWLSEIELTRFDQFRGYWIDRGWAVEAPVKLQSRIDRPRGPLTPGPTVIAGVAWSPQVGIAAVEVQVNGEPWRRANLGGDLGVDTWRQWWVPWDATTGSHRLRCRAIDGRGMVQTEEVLPVVPDGATGWHTRMVRVNP